MSDANVDAMVAALRPVVQAFETLRILHYVGGSVASSFHGAMRSTMDVDVVAKLDYLHVGRLVSMLNDQYYASDSAIRGAINHKSCFNLIHYPTSFKVDVFVYRGRDFDESAFSRAALGQLGADANFKVPIASAEDIVISKLEWFRLGGESSERQWNDISTVLTLLGDRADVDYLRLSARPSWRYRPSQSIDHLLIAGSRNYLRYTTAYSRLEYC